MERDKESFFRETSAVAEEYVRERLHLLKLQAAEKTARLVSIFFSGLIIILFALLLLSALSAMAAYFIKEKTGSWYYGFGIVSVFYIAVISVLVFFRDKFLHKVIADMVIRVFFEKTETGDEVKI